MKHGARRVHRDRGAGNDLGIVPSLAFAIADDGHVIGKYPSEPRLGEQLSAHFGRDAGGIGFERKGRHEGLRGYCHGLSALAEQVNMAGPNASTELQGGMRASPLFLREAEIRRGIELLYFGYGTLTRAADEVLARHGLGRAHHRAMYFIARRSGLTVGELLKLLAITKQSLGRVLSDLTERDLVGTASGSIDRRQKLLRLTPTGATLEHELFEAFRERLAAAYRHAGQEAVTGFWQVLEGLMPIEDRALAIELGRQA